MVRMDACGEMENTCACCGGPRTPNEEGPQCGYRYCAACIEDVKGMLRRRIMAIAESEDWI